MLLKEEKIQKKRDEILAEYSDINFAYNDSTRYDNLLRLIDELIDEVRPRGAWIPCVIDNKQTGFDTCLRCNNCGFGLVFNSSDRDFINIDYCKNCASIMTIPPIRSIVNREKFSGVRFLTPTDFIKIDFSKVVKLENYNNTEEG